MAADLAACVDLAGRKIIVTGASAGSLGYETARTLAAWGAQVIVTARTAPESVAAALRAQAPHARVDAQALDLSRADSVAQFAQWYRDTHGPRLDVLVNNAGVHLDLLSQWQQPQLTPDGYEIHWRTNYLGTMHLTHLLLPLLLETGKQTGNARIVNVVSMLHTRGSNAGLFAPQKKYNSWVAYGLSKLALVHATFELQRRYAAQQVQAYCLHPGAVLTKIADKGLDGNPLIQRVRNALRPLEALFLMTPVQGAQTSIHCATHPQLQGGRYFRNLKPARASTEADDVAVAARLWRETETWMRTVGWVERSEAHHPGLERWA